jgi:hypothetical protein
MKTLIFLIVMMMSMASSCTETPLFKAKEYLSENRHLYWLVENRGIVIKETIQDTVHIELYSTENRADAIATLRDVANHRDMRGKHVFIKAFEHKDKIWN